MTSDTSNCPESFSDMAKEFIPQVIIDPEDEIPVERFERLDQVIKTGLRACADAGFALREIRDEELWREGGYSSWDHYCLSLHETTRSYINRLIKHATIKFELQEGKPPYEPLGDPILPVVESQSRPLTKLPTSKERAKAWRIAVKRAEGVPTAKIVMEVVAEMVGDPPVKGQPSRSERRLELISHLRHEVTSRGSWERITALIDLLEKLESPKTQTI